MTRRIDPALIPVAPTLEYEKSLWQSGIKHIAGVDEAGRGALAGPVSAAAVVLPNQPNLITLLAGVRDSKQMTAKQRAERQKVIQQEAVSWAVGFASSDEIDHFGIVPATRFAMQRALQNLSVPQQHILIDAMLLAEVETPQTSLIKGDARSLSIAAASVLAKVARDEWISAKDKQYPGYKLANNKGYGTLAHRTAISKNGPSPIHRPSFAPMRLE
ncbi:MAG: ribonuclease HII [Chloroflexota bacterium]